MTDLPLYPPALLWSPHLSSVVGSEWGSSHLRWLRPSLAGYCWQHLCWHQIQVSSLSPTSGGSRGELHIRPVLASKTSGHYHLHLREGHWTMPDNRMNQIHSTCYCKVYRDIWWTVLEQFLRFSIFLMNGGKLLAVQYTAGLCWYTTPARTVYYKAKSKCTLPGPHLHWRQYIGHRLTYLVVCRDPNIPIWVGKDHAHL